VIDGIGSTHQIGLEAIERHQASLESSAAKIASGRGDLAESAAQVRIDSLGIRFGVAILDAANKQAEAILDLFA